LAAGSEQGKHQLAAKLLPYRMVRGQSGQFANHLVVSPEFKLELDASFDHP
jgi:hypothetical protein